MRHADQHVGASGQAFDNNNANIVFVLMHEKMRNFTHGDAPNVQ